MMADYPSTLPKPQIEGYQVQINYGHSGVTFENGNRRQRRGFKKEVYTFQFSLVLTTRQLWTWQSWANDFGYAWHWMDMQTDFVGTTPTTVTPHYIRYTDDISIEAIDQEHFRVTVQAEMDLNTAPRNPEGYSGNFIEAKTPSNIATDIIVAGILSALSADLIIAGTPDNPAA